jgi:hypothetical protein
MDLGLYLVLYLVLGLGGGLGRELGGLYRSALHRSLQPMQPISATLNIQLWRLSWGC